jgi:ribonuclease Z
MTRRNFAITVIALFAIVAIAAYSLRGRIALAVMERLAESALARDTLAELPDGLHLVVCGAGAPLTDPRRSGPCLAVIAGESLFLVDAGAAAARSLSRVNLPAGRIEALFLTHFHSDHIDGVGEVMLQRWVGAPQTAPLPVLGPSGVESVVEGFNAAYRLDSLYRTAHHGVGVAPSATRGGVARAFRPPAAGEDITVWQMGDLTVRAFSVEHDPVTPAVGYRFDYRGRSLVVSGDTAKSANLARAARGADLLAHEALDARMVAILERAATRAGRENVARIMHDIPSYHATPVEAAEIARDAQVRHLLLHHIVPPLVVPGAEAAFVEGVADVFEGAVTLTRDGTRVSLPAGSDRISVTELL